MKVIFLGGFFPKEFSKSILANSLKQVQNSADRFQWAFIKGLNANLSNPIKLITAPFIGWFPKYYKLAYLKKADIENGYMVSFPNFPIVKNIFKYYNLLAILKKEVNGESKAVVIVYSLDTAYLKAALRAKKYNSNLKVCVIVPDLLEFPGNAPLLYRMFIKYHEKPTFYRLVNKVDGFVVLTEKMVDFLNIGSKPWIRIEGLYDVIDDFPKKNLTNSDLKIILYTGTLDFQYGIGALLDAFDMIKKQNYRLWICGGGIGSSLVNERVKTDKRINYMGILSQEEITALQVTATLLVNPRDTVAEFNKYSFPSKTMEYLASGTPALIYKLDGIPQEYYNYCYTVEGNGMENLSASMERICEKEPLELYNYGKKAQDFIFKFKNSVVQTSKMITLIEEITK